MGQHHVYLIGHISEDLILSDEGESTRMGGAVAYMAKVFKNLGWMPHIITKLPQNHRYLQQLNQLGIEFVHNLPIRDDAKKDAMTTFTIKNKGESRDIFLKDQQEDITVDDIRPLLADIERNSLFIAAPVMKEVDGNIIPFLNSLEQKVVLCPQGYYRNVIKDGQIYNSFPEEFGINEAKNRAINRAIYYADMVIFGREDLNFLDKTEQDNYIREMAQQKPVFVTDASHGSAYYYGDTEIIVDAFQLKDGEQRDFTGVGDSYSAALIYSMSRGVPLLLDMHFASLYSGIKGMTMGVDGLPDGIKVRDFVTDNFGRVRNYSPLLNPYIGN